MMTRRTFLCGLTLGTLSAPLAADAQQAGKIYRIGAVSGGSSFAEGSQLLMALRQGLRDVGYVEGQNLFLERRNAEGRYDRFPEFIDELVRLGVDVILVGGPAGARAAQLATTTTPFVVIDLESDPVESGFVASLSRPGGNLTGLFLDMPELTGKWLELLKEAAPEISRVAVLWDSTTGTTQVRATEEGARALALRAQTFAVGGPAYFNSVLDAVRKTRPGGLVVLSSPLLLHERKRLADFASKSRLPAISMFREFADAGGLMAYGPNFIDMNRRVGTVIDRILKGAKPADVPIERPTKFELVINLKTAKALGLTIPQSLLVRADQLIE